MSNNNSDNHLPGWWWFGVGACIAGILILSIVVVALEAYVG